MDRLLVRGLLAIGRFCQKSTVSGRLREKSIVGGRLSEKKGRRRSRGKEEKKKRGEERPSACMLSSPARCRRPHAVLAGVLSPPVGRQCPRAVAGAFSPARGEVDIAPFLFFF
ncbi:hypothetical protein GW17_00025229 [Ensete ventricosum]|nr:hypothetical protein GW17_00025229 [Ensete ventricosum]